MTDQEFLQKMLDINKITQERFDAGLVKLQGRKLAKDKAKTDLNKLTKAELIVLVKDLS